MLKRSSIWKYSKTLSNAELFCKFHRCSFCQYHALLLHSCKFDVLTWMICWPIGCIVKMCWGFYAQLLRIVKTLIPLNTLASLMRLQLWPLQIAPASACRLFACPTGCRSTRRHGSTQPERQACFLRWEHVANSQNVVCKYGRAEKAQNML